MKKLSMSYFAFVFLGLISGIILWADGLNEILQPIAMIVLFLSLIIPFVYKEKNISGIFYIAFFAAVLFISIYVINSLINNGDKNSLKDDVKIYGIVSGCFFWGGVLFFIVSNFIKSKKQKGIWKKEFKSLGKIIVISITYILIQITLWVIILYVWKGLDKESIALISKKIIMISLTWVPFSIIIGINFKKINNYKLNNQIKV